MSGSLPVALAGTATGAVHLRRGDLGQDAVLSGVAGEFACVALADGHGSAARGAEGAAVAVDCAVTILFEFAAQVPGGGAHRVEALARDLIRPRLVARWRAAIQDEVPDDRDLRCFGCTLLAALAGPSWVLVLQLGDGDLLRVSGDGRVDRPLPPDERCFADETTSMCLPTAPLDLRVTAWPRPADESLLVLATDGYANSYADDDAFERVGPDWLALLRAEGVDEVTRRLPAILHATSAGGCGDDVSLGLLWIPPGARGETT